MAVPASTRAREATFMQDRLRLLGKTVFLLSFGFYIAINGLYFAGGGEVIQIRPDACRAHASGC
jgi:hypothetical protein